MLSSISRQSSHSRLDYTREAQHVRALGRALEIFLHRAPAGPGGLSYLSGPYHSLHSQRTLKCLWQRVALGALTAGGLSPAPHRPWIGCEHLPHHTPALTATANSYVRGAKLRPVDRPVPVRALPLVRALAGMLPASLQARRWRALTGAFFAAPSSRR